MDFKWVDPTIGERHRPIEVLPKVTVNLADNVLIFTDPKPKPLTVKLKGAVEAFLKPVPEAPAA